MRENGTPGNGTSRTLGIERCGCSPGASATWVDGDVAVGMNRPAVWNDVVARPEGGVGAGPHAELEVDAWAPGWGPLECEPGLHLMAWWEQWLLALVVIAAL